VLASADTAHQMPRGGRIEVISLAFDARAAAGDLWESSAVRTQRSFV